MDSSSFHNEPWKMGSEYGEQQLFLVAKKPLPLVLLSSIFIFLKSFFLALPLGYLLIRDFVWFRLRFDFLDLWG